VLVDDDAMFVEGDSGSAIGLELMGFDSLRSSIDDVEDATLIIS
jgi:hypothetical protein